MAKQKDKGKKVHVVSHTHWDREWRLPFDFFQYQLTRCIDLLLEIMKRDKRYKAFLLDGQSIMLEDYLAARPEVKSARSKKSTENNLKRWADPEFKAKVSAAMKGKKKTLTPAALEARRKNFAKAWEKRKASSKAT